MGPGVQLLGLLERFEDPFERVLRDARSAIDHADLDPGLRSGDPITTGSRSPENSRPFSTSSSRIRAAATRFRVASIGRPGDSTRTRGDPRDLVGDVDHVGVLGQPRLHHALEAGDEARESLGAHHERGQHLVALLARARALRQGLGHPEDHRHRGAELVPEPAQQLVAPRSALEERLLRELELARAASLALEGLGELADHARRHLRRDHAAAGRGLTDRVEDLLAVGVLQDVAGGPGDEHLPDRVLVVDAGERDDPHVGERGLQQAGGFDAVHLRHPDVHQHDVGARGAHEVEGVGPRPTAPTTTSSSVPSSEASVSRKPGLSSTTATRIWDAQTERRGGCPAPSLEVSAR